MEKAFWYIIVSKYYETQEDEKMKKTIGIDLYKPDKDTIDELRYLTELIHGEIAIREMPIVNRSAVTIHYDTDLLKRSYVRKLGRKSISFDDGEIELEELERRIKENGAKQTADELKVSRATLFRKLKKARENGVDTVK